MSKKLFRNFGLLFLAASTMALAACDSANKTPNTTVPGTQVPTETVKPTEKPTETEKPQAEAKASFMVQNEAGSWEVLKEEKAINGKVTLPEAPAKKYYQFVGWYSNKELTEQFNNSNINSSVKAYAKYIAVEVKIFINGEDLGEKNLVDVINGTYNPAEGLEFDGWYKDAACKVKWNEKDDVTEIYAQTVAAITYNNGYEDLIVEKVKPGTLVENPAKRQGEATTFEKEKLVKEYMSDRDIEYVDENGDPIDFTKPVTRSMNITVKWHSPYDDGSYKLNEKTGNYYMEFYSKLDYPVLSFGSDVTIMENEAAKKITVEAIHIYGSGWLSQNTKKIIFNDGIKSIKGMNGEGVSAVEEIVLPKTIKIIDGSFNNMPNLRDVKLPDGLEVIIGSFFKASKSDYKTYYMGTVHSFDINVPASVINMAQVPNNFTFAEGSRFFKGEDNCIYLSSEKGKILISDPQAYSTFDKDPDGFVDTIVVPSCDGIQVGTYNVAFNYMFLPEAFKFVNYNASIENYKYYVGMEGSAYSFSSIALYDAASMEAPSAKMAPSAYSITNYLGGFNIMGQKVVGAGIVVFATEALPETLHKLAFCGDSTGWAIMSGAYQDMTNATLKEKVVLKDAVNKVFVTSNALPVQITVSLTAATIDQDAIFAEMIAVNPELQATLDKATSIKYYSNGKEITLGEVTSDMYITMEVVVPEEAPQA